MIKINLLYNVGDAQRAREGSLFGKSVAGPEGGPGGLNRTDVAVKALLFAFPLLLSKGYTEFEIATKKSEKTAYDARAESLKQEVAAFGPQIQAVKKFQEEKQRLQVQIETIKQLSKERLRNVKALDALHGLVPERVWLTQLKMDGVKVDIAGNAIEDGEVSAFIQALEESILFTGVQLIKSEEIKSTEGAVKSFVLTCKLENI